MSKPITIPNIFQNQTGPIPLAQLDADFSTGASAINDFLTYTNGVTDTGTTNALIVTILSPLTFAYTLFVALDVQVSNTTTSTAPTINVNSLGAKTIVNIDGSALSAAALQSGGIYRLVYDGTNFRTQSQVSAGSFKQLTVGVPTSGVALTVNAAAGTAGISLVGTDIANQNVVSSGATNRSSILFLQGGNTNGYIGADGGQSLVTGSSNGDFVVRAGVGASAGTLRFVTSAAGASTQMVINTVGNVVVNIPGSGVALTVNGATSGSALKVISGVSGASAATDFELDRAGSTANAVGQGPNITLVDTTNSTETLLQEAGGQTELWHNVSGIWTQLLRITSGHLWQAFGPVNGGPVDMTPDKGSWTTTLSGPWIVGNNPTGTMKWERQGNLVTVWVDANITQTATIVSNISISAVPASITPSSQRTILCGSIQDNGATPLVGILQLNTNNTFTLFVAIVSGTHLIESQFSGAGQTGIQGSWSISYSL